MRVQLIRHFKTCTTDIYLHKDCAHVGLIVHAPVLQAVRSIHRAHRSQQWRRWRAYFAHWIKAWRLTVFMPTSLFGVACFFFFGVAFTSLCVPGWVFWVSTRLVHDDKGLSIDSGQFKLSVQLLRAGSEYTSCARSSYPAADPPGSKY